MDKIYKAIGAGGGGAMLGVGTSALALPEGTPWYGHAGLIVFFALLPALTAYFAPKNAP